MKKSAIINILFVASLFTVHLNATNYYIDSKGGADSNTGISITKPWRSMKNLLQLKLVAGDSVFFKKGSVFNEPLKLELEGEKDQPIYVGTYGDNSLPRPVINGLGQEQYGLLLENPAYCEIYDLEITNTGKEREVNRFGVYIKARNSGVRHSVKIENLLVRDVNGSLVKQKGAGGGIYWENSGDSINTCFDGLVIKDCHILNCGRNGIYSGGYAGRDNWFPSLNVHIVGNLIEGVPGDGIVPIGCDGALIEYNIMRDCPDILSYEEAAAGIWPWSCDNTIIQYNEVSGHNAKWDGQGFDADYNCHGTIIQYNYSHDNAGGFLLICNDGYSLGKNWNKGTTGTIIRYNISVNDGLRKYPTKQAGWFTPTIHITGPVENTEISNNLIVVNNREVDTTDYRIIKMGDWGNKWPVKTNIQNNIFQTQDGVVGIFEMGGDQETIFSDNFLSGNFKDKAETTTKVNKKDIQKVLDQDTVEEKITALKKLFNKE
ncbi:right-handed parallel beta-helix repeat-containing protein [Carboxylicivirga caseinilyticus]|uniref:right-handed parallel beta-helix repeat-containing protein n=1 Tax=Carboxylicivirga caseinilyticus TaxID=3417572 RepID=UPI003D3465B7|nr:hypothetical protein [Marinilabiliaceae bacterium A049]